MKVKVTFLLGLALLFGGTAFAQSSSSSESSRAEAAVDYSFVSFYPASNLANRHSLNGGGGSFAYFWKDLYGVKADFQGYASNTTTFTIPAGNPVVPAGGTFKVQGNLFTYLFGPVIQPRQSKIAPFGQILFGGAHSNLYGDFYNVTGHVGTAPSNNSFSMAVGGGIDFRIKNSIYFRPVEFNYLLTDFVQPTTTNHQVQSNFQYKAGITFRF
jgi:hypothetical protein